MFNDCSLNSVCSEWEQLDWPARGDQRPLRCLSLSVLLNLINILYQQDLLLFSLLKTFSTSFSSHLLSARQQTDCAGQRSQVSDKRTAASNRLRGHLAISQSNTASAIELTEMKERICAGFKFKAGGVNCSFQMAKESVAIAKLFGECRDIMISRCRRKQSEFFCEKGKVNRKESVLVGDDEKEADNLE